MILVTAGVRLSRVMDVRGSNL